MVCNMFVACIDYCFNFSFSAGRQRRCDKSFWMIENYWISLHNRNLKSSSLDTITDNQFFWPKISKVIKKVTNVFLRCLRRPFFQSFYVFMTKVLVVMFSFNIRINFKGRSKLKIFCKLNKQRFQIWNKIFFIYAWLMRSNVDCFTDILVYIIYNLHLELTLV
jgi:hypothetical protein